MEASFWIERWREGRIGFHEGTPNEFLVRHGDRLVGTRVLVPLCGKSEDLAYLAGRGHEVVGIELVEDAVRAFFTEHDVTPTITRHPAGVTTYAAGGITLIAGDLFAITGDMVGTIDAIYDRAAMVALPPETRRRYVPHLGTLVPSGTRSLLITFEYAQERFAGPPFAVLEPEVRALYGTVELLESRADTTSSPALAALAPIESCYVVTLA